MPLVFTLIAATLGLCATALLTWALIGDRAKGRRRCPKCWYNLAGVPTISTEPNANDPQPLHTRCPECGHLLRREHHARRTRRRWRWALASLPLFALAYASLVGPAVVEQGARAAIPTLALLYGPYDLRALAEPDLYPEPTGRIAKAMFDELKRRLDEHRLRGWETGLFQSRLRGAYSRVRLLGLTTTERNAIAALSLPTPLAREGLVRTPELLVALAASGLAIEVSNSHPLEDVRVNLHRLAPKTLAALLDNVGNWIGQEWTIVERRVVFTNRLAMTEHTRYMVVDLRELAPAKLLPAPLSALAPAQATPPKRIVNRSLSFQLEQALTAFVAPDDWKSNGGNLADLTLLDDTMIVRARAPTIVRVESFFHNLHSAQRGSHPFTPVAAAIEDATTPTDIVERWYSLRGLFELPEIASYVKSASVARSNPFRRSQRLLDAPVPVCDHLEDLFNLYGHAEEFFEPAESRYAIVGPWLLVRTTVENHKRFEQFLVQTRQSQATPKSR